MTTAVARAVAGVPPQALTVRSAQRLPAVPAVQEHLDAVLVAMVESALRRSPPGARVLVRTELTAGRPGTPDRIRVQVADRGPDLAGEARHRLPAVPSGSPGTHRTTAELACAAARLSAAGGGALSAGANPGGGLLLTLALTTAARPGW
ncbi:hypothetical protein ACFC1T_30040 [Kitasatospora sp. NPDC056076]|uniref:hypothetical protein n=1 Tax=Kitasatospora sp. NPDC056076 TaxID=3345703 RepID=UPI0035DF5D9E